MAEFQKLKITDFFLQDIEMAFHDNSFMAEWYIDVQENSVVFLPDEYFPENEELIELVENDIEGERFIPINHRTSSEGYAQMERFIDGLSDPKKQEILYNAIDGRGAFQRFKDRLYDVDLSEEWHEFKGREDRAKVLEWLYVEGLIEEEDIEKGKQMYEDILAKRKQREANMKKMVKDAVVICSNNSGHADKVTPGKTYEVLDEQEQHQNIRIKDDRGKVIWIPKAHFELVSEA